MILGIPTIQLLLFGFAINLDVRHLSAAVVDQSGSSASRAHSSQTVAHSQVADVHAILHSSEAADALMRRGEISMILVIPHDLDRRLASREREALQLIVDASDPTIQAAARQLVAMPLPGIAEARVPAVAVLNRYNPERRSAINTVPGLIGVILTMTMTLFTAVAIVRERERGNIEMLIATPVSSLELILGKVLPFVLIGVVQVTVVLALGVLIFAVPIRGELGSVYVAALTYIVAALSLGVFLSTFAQHPVPGHADGLLHLPAADPAVRLHVSVRRHAQGSAVVGRDPAAHPLHPPDPRHHAARRQPRRTAARAVGAARLHRPHAHPRHPALPQAVGLRLTPVSARIHSAHVHRPPDRGIS